MNLVKFFPKSENLTSQFFCALMLCTLLVFSSMTMGCTSAQISKVVTIVETDLPVVLQDVSSIITIVSALSTSSDTAASMTTIQTVLTEIQTKATDVETILASYKAGKTTWASVIAAVDALYSASATVIDLASIKDADSQAKAKAWLAAIDLIVNTIYTAVLTTESTDTIRAKTTANKTHLVAAGRSWSPEQRSFFVSQLQPITGLGSFSQYTRLAQ